MSLVAIARRLPQDLQLPMLEFAEAVEEDLRAKLAVRREDFEALQATVRELAEAQKRTEETLRKLIMRVDRIEVKLGGLVGDNLERKYRERPFAYLGQVLRPVHSVSLQDLLPQLEARLSEAELDELLPLDVLLRGQVRELPNRPEIWLAMEVSAVVDETDVERAVIRARALAKAGLRTMPAVAGEEFTEGARLLAIRQKVLMLQDGRRHNWLEALEQLFDTAGR